VLLDVDDLGDNPVTASSCQPGEERSCFEGPEGTEGVGPCHAGTQLCLASGRGFGPCLDQQLPGLEDCATDEDENCDGITSCGETIWSRSFGSGSSEAVSSVDGAADGGVAIAGYYRDPVDFGGAPLADGGSNNLFVARLDADGEHLWSDSLYGNDEVVGHGVASSPGGAVAVVGRFRGSMQGGPQGPVASAGGRDGLVAVFASDGSPRWLTAYGDDQEQILRAVDIDAAGNLWVAGYFEGRIDMGDGEHISRDLNDVVVAKLAIDGEAKWSRSFEGLGDQFALALAATPDGGVVVGGHFFGSISVGGQQLEARGDARDVFVIKLDAEGLPVWSRRFGDEANQRCVALAVDGEGNVVLGAYGEGAPSFGGAPLETRGASDVFVAKLNPEGEHVFSARYGDHGGSALYGLALDAAGRVAITGYYEGGIDFGLGALRAGGVREPNLFVAKLDPAGAPLYSRGYAVRGDQWGGPLTRAWRSVAFDQSGDLWLAGFFRGPELELEEGAALVNSGAADVFVARLAP
jgi:hypothetical protein